MVSGNGETRKLAEPSWMPHRRRRRMHRVGRTHAVTGVMRVVPRFRHHHRIVEIPTGFSQWGKIVDSQPLTTG